METCDWCGKEISGWFYRYKGLTFCQRENDRCLKEFLFAEHHHDITEDRTDGEVLYDMRKVEECYYE